MLDIFDYIVFRVYRFYHKKSGNPIVYATGVLTLLQFFILLTFEAAISLIVNYTILSKEIIIPLIIGLIAFNWNRYERDFDFRKLEEKWVSEDLNKSYQRGWLIIVALVCFFLFPIVIGILRHNLGVIR